MTEGRHIAQRIQRRLDKINNEPQSDIRRDLLLRLFKREMQNANKVDVSYFKVMEIDLDKNHQAEVNAALA